MTSSVRFTFTQQQLELLITGLGQLDPNIAITMAGPQGNDILDALAERLEARCEALQNPLNGRLSLIELLSKIEIVRDEINQLHEGRWDTPTRLRITEKQNELAVLVKDRDERRAAKR